MAEIGSARKHTIIEKAKKDGQERKRNILHLILGYLREHGLERTSEALQEEAQIGTQFEACENVDLDIILQEYQSYYFTKFQKPPKLVRKITDPDEYKKKDKRTPAKKKSVWTIPKNENVKIDSQEKNGDADFQFEIISLTPEQKIRSNKELYNLELPYYLTESYTGELKEFAQVVAKEIIRETSCSFSDCIGIDNVIECLKEATIYPIEYPELFQNLYNETWSGILLYGPPGSGKTLLAKAVASETKCTFFNLTSSTFISKWRGESEKMLKVLFDMAKYYAPTVIFIDELDAIICEGNHEASRRFKSELLIQMDGILKTTDSIFVLATTNHPWSLDKATLRRFEKKILVDLPDEANRQKLFAFYLKKYGGNLSREELEMIAKKSLRFSGHDIKTVCKEARMSIIRDKIKNKSTLMDNVLGIITFDNLKKSLDKIKSGISETESQRYRDWSKEYGST